MRFVVQVETDLKGATSQYIDVFMPSHEAGAELSIPGRPLPDCGDRGVWFLVKVDDLNGYVLTNTTGPLLSQAGEEQVTGTEESSQLAQEVVAFGGELDDVVQHLRTLSE